MADEQRTNMESRDRAHKPTPQEMTQQRQQGITGNIDLGNNQHHDTAADVLHSGEAQQHPMTQTPQQRKGQTAAMETRREGGSETNSRKEQESTAEKRSGGGSEPKEGKNGKQQRGREQGGAAIPTKILNYRTGGTKCFRGANRKHE
jgi:hypothetical protein